MYISCRIWLRYQNCMDRKQYSPDRIFAAITLAIATRFSAAVNRTLPLSLDGSVKLKLGLPLNSRGLVSVYNPGVNLDLDFQPLISPWYYCFLTTSRSRVIPELLRVTFRYLPKRSIEMIE